MSSHCSHPFCVHTIAKVLKFVWAGCVQRETSDLSVGGNAVLLHSSSAACTRQLFILSELRSQPWENQTSEASLTNIMQMNKGLYPGCDFQSKATQFHFLHELLLIYSFLFILLKELLHYGNKIYPLTSAKVIFFLDKFMYTSVSPWTLLFFM